MSATRALTAATLATALLLPGAVNSARAAEAPYEIPVINELTGSSAFIGTSEKQAIELAEKTINDGGGIKGRPLHFVFHDNQSNPQVSVQLANEVLATNPAVVIGPTLVGDCGAMAPLFHDGPVLICLTPSFHPAIPSYTYASDTSTRDSAIAGLRYFRLKGWTRIAVITSTDATGRDALKNILEIAKFPENRDLTLVANTTFNTTDISVSAQIEGIKAANPQAIVAWSVGTPIATVFRGLQDAGIDLPVATSAGNEVFREMDQFAAFLPKQLYFFTPPWPAAGDPTAKLPPEINDKQKEFFDAFHAAGIEPDDGSANAWEPAMLIAATLDKLGIDATAARIQDYFQHLKGLASVSGYYDFEKTPQRGLAATLVSRWSPGEKRWQVVSEIGGTPLP